MSTPPGTKPTGTLESIRQFFTSCEGGLTIMAICVLAFLPMLDGVDSGKHGGTKHAKHAPPGGPLARSGHGHGNGAGPNGPAAESAEEQEALAQKLAAQREVHSAEDAQLFGDREGKPRALNATHVQFKFSEPASRADGIRETLKGMGTVEKDEWGQLDREHLAEKLASWQDAEAQVHEKRLILERLALQLSVRQGQGGEAAVPTQPSSPASPAS